MQDKQFDQFFKDKVEGFESPVGRHIWEHIQAQLEPESKPVVVLDKKRRNVWWIRVAAAVVLVVGAIMFYINRPTEVVYLTAKKVQQQEMPHQGKGVVSAEPVAKERPSHAINKKESHRVVEQVSKARKESAMPKQMAQQSDAGIKASFDDAIPVSEAVKITHPMMADEIKTADLAAIDMETMPAQHEMAQREPFEDTVPGEPMKRIKNKKELAAGDILEYVASSVSPRNEKIISFASDEEGTIKVAVNFKALKIRL